MKGRKPRPTHLKVIEGERNKDRINLDEPKFEPNVPTCPRHLSKEARREWRRLATGLFRMGMLTDVDRGVFAAYCQAWGRWVEAENEIAKSGPVLRAVLRNKDGNVIKDEDGNPVPGGYYQNPFLAVANRAWSNMVKAAAEMGISPSSRSRIVVSKPSGKRKGIEEFID